MNDEDINDLVPIPATGALPDDEALVLVPGELFTLGELHAMKLDSVLRSVFGDAFRAVDIPESMEVRAAALGQQIPPALLRRAAVGQLSAAWVYGCAPTPQPIALLLGLAGKSAQLPLLSGCTLRQVRLDPSDVQELGGTLVTTPLRTALDVARTAPPQLARTVLTAMSQQSSLHCPLVRVWAALTTAVHVPGKLRGQTLLASMLEHES